jgi:hypothetical protein
VRRTSERQGATAEEGPAQVRSPAAAAGDDLPRRSLERRVPTVDDAGSDEDAECVRVARDVELVPGRGVERPTPVGPDLRAEPALAEERERAPSRGAATEVEMQTPAPCAAQVEAARGVEQRGELCSSVALALRRDRRELLANVLRRDQRTTPSRASNRRLMSTPASP